MLVDERCYSFYVTTNSAKTVLYCGVTNDLLQRVSEHYLSRGGRKTFAGRYYCYWLVYYEDYSYIDKAIEREKEIKKWSRIKKNRLIESLNPTWEFFNHELFERWPPVGAIHRKDL